MPLTKCDLGTGPQMYIVATRPGGDTFIVDSLPVKERDRAERLLAVYRRHLEGCERIELESEVMA